MIEIGSSYERAQTSAFKTTNAMRDAIALMGMFALRWARQSWPR